MTTVHLEPYGRPALDAVRERVNAAKGGDPLALVTILVPDNVTALTVRRFLAREAVAGVVVTTLARFAEQLAAPLLAPRQPATTAVLAAHWRVALAGDDGPFAEVAEHPGTVRALVRAHRELRHRTDEELDAVAAADPVAESLVRLHRVVRDGAAARHYDSVDLLRAAAALLEARPARGHVLLVAASRLEPAEVDLVAALHHAGSLEVVACVANVRRADGDVVDSLSAAGLAVPPVPAGHPRAVAGALLDASDADDEVRAVVRHVVRRLRDVPAERIAVLYPAAVPYARLLHERFAAAGVRINGRGVRSVLERAVPRAFLGLLALAESRFARTEVIRVLGEAPIRIDGAVVPLARWDRLAREAGVVGGDDWTTRPAVFAAERRAEAAALLLGDDPQPQLAAHRTKDADDAVALGNAIGNLRGMLERGADLDTWPELADWLRELFEHTVGDPAALRALPPEEQYGVVALLGSIDALGGLGAVEARADLATAVGALTLQLDAAVPRVGRFGEGVHVSALGEAALLDVDAVFVVGLAEDLCPGRVREDALLGSAARLAGGLAPLRTRVDALHRAVLAALAAAPALASFPRGDLRRSTQRHPSRFLLPSLRELAGDHELAASDWERVPESVRTSSSSFAAALLATPDLSDAQEWRVRAAAAQAWEDDTVAAARGMLAARAGDALTRYDGDLRHVADGLPDYADGVRVVAPTTLEQVAQCPHAFFVERVLGVRHLEAPEEVVEPPANEIGTLVHRCFDRLAREASELPRDGAPWSAADRARLLAIFDEEADRVSARGLMGHPRLWALERDTLRRDLPRMLDDDDAWRAARRASVVASELTFGLAGEPAVVLDVERGSVRLRGSADRVDRRGDGTLIVTDLKTGSARTYGDLETDPVGHGQKMQLPAYARAALARHGRPGDAVEAAYWFVRRDESNKRAVGRGKRVTVALDEATERAYRRAVGTLVDSVAAGILPPVPPEKPDFSWVQCWYCNPDGLGHGEARERWERQRHDPALRAFLTLTDPDAAAAAEAVAAGGPADAANDGEGEP
ncbi:PD-(D/E)XK nuclease family protein [Miniimonas arenae]|uniref:PD-(D/E)XK nuclease family protein n=1 Tax=Miniimonas arenae TaxID=676201 RepID=A0A5C5BF31_9MICO|nr:PD-(D/E)XK nuclease family protein [Miniimonas arenae]TNU76519.1 PD-(D/E)XK nuclease family protein [Miniimonas arenae]